MKWAGDAAGISNCSNRLSFEHTLVSGEGWGPMSEADVQRRLTTILAVDVVGYSRLMAADETGTHARMKALWSDVIEPKSAEHHGRTVKLMGDGSLWNFPA